MVLCNWLWLVLNLTVHKPAGPMEGGYMKLPIPNKGQISHLWTRTTRTRQGKCPANMCAPVGSAI